MTLLLFTVISLLVTVTCWKVTRHNLAETETSNCYNFFAASVMVTSNRYNFFNVSVTRNNVTVTIFNVSVKVRK